MEELNTTPVQVSTPDDEKLFATFCYIPVISILSAPYAVSKFPKSTFVGVHAAQGLGLFVVWFLNLVVITALSYMLSGLFVLGLIVLSVYGGMMAWGGKELKIPVVLQIGEKLLGFIKGFVVKKGKEVVDGMNNAVGKVGDAIGVTTPATPEAPVVEDPVAPVVEAAPVVETPAPEATPVVEVPVVPEVKPEMEVKVETPAPVVETPAPEPVAPVTPEETKPVDTPPTPPVS